MADTKDSALTEASYPLTGAEIVKVVQGGNDRRVPAAKLAQQRNYFENIYGGVSLTSVINATAVSKRPYLIPINIPGQISQQRSIAFYGSRAAGTSVNMTGGLAWYSATDSTNLSRYASETFAISATTSSLWSGVRQYNIALTSISSVSLSAGNWWLAMYFAGSNDSTVVQQMALMGNIRGESAVAGSVFTGTNQTSATNATKQLYPFQGVHSTTQATNTPFPATIAQSDVTGGAGSGLAPTIYFQITP